MWHFIVLAAILFIVSGARADAQFNVLRHLEFGVVLSGTSKTIAPTDATSAFFHTNRTLGLVNVISFTVTPPTNGAASLPVTLCSTCGRYRINNNNPAGATVFNPPTGFSQLIVLLSDIYIWVGGTVSPPLNQKPGQYTGGTLVLTIAGLL